MKKHSCTTFVLRCMDFRLGAGEIRQVLFEADAVPAHFDEMTVAGGVKSLVTPQLESDRDFILRHIELSRKLHNIKNVVLVNHQDCGAYGGSSALANEGEELKAHSADLRQAAKIIKQRFPDLTVQTYLAKLNPAGKNWVIKLKPVS